MKPHFYGPGKEVCVVGASRGIGAELVRQLLARGCDRVYATERVVGKSPALAAFAKDERNGDRLRLLSVDTSDGSSIAAFAESLAKDRTTEKKKKPLDLVITNAGIAEWSSLQSVTAETMIRLFATNTVGPLLVAQQLEKQGILGKGSTLGNMTSKMGSMADNGSGGALAYR